MNTTILLVDDDSVSLKLASYLLRREGYRVLQARDAEGALGLIGKSLPDLLLLDPGLQKTHGFALLHHLRGNERTKALRVVAVTSHAMKGDAEHAISQGFDGYITKPIDTRNFPRQIQGFIPKLSRDSTAPDSTL